MEFKEEFEALHKAVADMRGMSEKALAEAKDNNGKIAADHKAALDRVNGRIDTLETIVSRAKTVNADADADAEKTRAKSARKEAMGKYLRKGKEALTPDEVKILSTTDDTQAGYLAPAEYVQEIIKASLLFSPIRQYARVMTTSQRDVEIPVRTATFAATWAGEAATKTETTGLKYGLAKIPAHELYAESLVTNQLLEDSAFDLDSELNREFAEQFGIAEGNAFVKGNGVSKPFGFVGVSGINNTNSANVGAVTFDDIFNTFYSIKSPYQANATWFAANSSWSTIRQLKDGQGRYLWEPSMQIGQPATLLGRPAIEATDMASIATGNVSLAVGDFSRGYRIVDRTQMVLLRDPYSYADSGKVRFLARRRVGGEVVLAEALGQLTIA